jgi:hypothetical protein
LIVIAHFFIQFGRPCVPHRRANGQLIILHPRAYYNYIHCSRRMLPNAIPIYVSWYFCGSR